MPPRHWQADGYAVVVFEGTYTAEAALEVLGDALAAPAPMRGLLLDLTDSESFRTRSADGLRAVAQFLGERQAQFGSRIALVGATDLAYGLLRMGIVYVSDHGIEGEVFRDRDQAIAWLTAG